MEAGPKQLENITLREAAEIAATDGAFFGEFFFPRTFRMRTPDYVRDLWDKLDEPHARHVSIQVFRGGAKTTVLRAFTAKRISYGQSNTILYIGKSQDHALRSVGWIMRQIETNPRWANTFGLSKGDKWTQEECEIKHGVDEYPIRIIANGITGSARGVNVDDYRPDLIILDDVIDDDNAATKEQRKKINDRIFGAIEKSLMRGEENPQAKLVMLQTPLDREDASELTQNDPEWHPLKFSCFDDKGNSRWEGMFATKELKKEKASAIRRNMLSLWLREMECAVVADEKRYFREHQLRYWEVLPAGMVVAIGIDPSPPKDEDPEARKKKDPDPEVLSAVGSFAGDVYLLEVVKIQDPNPEKTTIELARLIRKWHPIVAGVETVAYQKTLKWYIEKQMMDGKCPHLRIEPLDDKRSKVKRIRHTFSDIVPDGKFYIHPSMLGFIEEFKDYPDVVHDDILDSVSMGIAQLIPYEGITIEGEYTDVTNQGDIPALPDWRSAP